MNSRRPIRRATAILASVLLALTQLALPLAALATADQTPPTDLPIVSVYYQSADGTSGECYAQYSSDGVSKRLWVQLPSADAFAGTLTLNITPPAAPEGIMYSYSPGSGTSLSGTQSSADFASGSTVQITAFQNDQPYDMYTLYLSANAMPLPTAEATITVYYIDADTNQEITRDSFPLTTGNYTILPTATLPEGYALTPESPQQYSVNVDAAGYADQSQLQFFFRKPSEPPAPPEPTVGEVTVYYVGANGMNLLDPYWTQATDGQTFTAPDIEGYTLAPECQPSYSVSVETDGTTTPSEIYFIYNEAAPPVTPTAEVMVHYILENGDPVATAHPVTLEFGTHTVTPTAQVDSGYQLMASYPASVDVTVTGQDEATPSEVYFYYEPVYVPPVTGTLTTHYTFTDNAGLNFDIPVPLEEGLRTVIPNASIPDGYALADGTPGSHDVTVNPDGSCSPAEVTFTYAPVYVPPVTGTLTTHYTFTDNAGLNFDIPVTLEEGPRTVTPNASIPDGYVLADGTPGSHDVTVNPDGSCSPAEVTFTYAPVYVPPVTGTLTTHYTFTDNAGLNFDIPVTLEEGLRTVTPNASIPDGYALADGTPGSHDVTVNPDGSCSPAEVTFTYAPVTVPTVTGTLTTHYAFTDNAGLNFDVPVTLEEGLRTVTPNAAVPNGYALAAGSSGSYDVTVNPDGSCSPAEVTFTYAPVTVPTVTGTLTTHYAFTDNVGLNFDIPVTLEEGPRTVTPSAAVPNGYALAAGSSASYDVTVNPDGSCSPAEVTFTYEPIMGRVIVRYLDQQNAPIVTEQSKTLPRGQSVITPEATIPQGYQLALDCPASYTVNVDENGLSNPATVTFYYSKNTPQYLGYGLINTRTTLRSDANSDDSSIKGMLEKDTLVIVNGQPTVAGVTWAGVQTLDSQIGLVLDSTVTRLTDAQAQPYIDAYKAAHATATPSPTPTPTAVPAQLSGYYVTVVNGAPLRMVTSQYSEVRAYLPLNTVVSVSGQIYNEGYGWHITGYGSLVGYVRADQLRKLTDAEVEAYKASLNTPTPAPQGTVQPYNPNATSSYGYITAGGVNFRLTPGGARIKTLNRYAFALILSTRVVNGTTWYNVNQNGTVGWIHGDYFHQMSLAELEGFLTSPEYYQGIANNAGTSGGGTSGGSTGTSSGTSHSTGSATAGNISSVEDWNVGVWQNPNASASATYAPFDPYATPSVTTSYEPFNPSASATPSANAAGALQASGSPAPEPTFVIGTMIPISYDDETTETQTDTPWALIIGGIVVLGGAGGVYAYALSQNKKRKAAAARAAAQRRAAQGANGQQNPYQRRAVAAAPYAPGQQRRTQEEGRSGQGQYRQPGNPPQGQNPYAQRSPQAQDAYRRPTGARDGLQAAPPLTGSRQTPYADRDATVEGARSPYARPEGQSPAPTQEDAYGAYERPSSYTPDSHSATRAADPYQRPADPYAAQRRPRVGRAGDPGNNGMGRNPEA